MNLLQVFKTYITNIYIDIKISFKNLINFLPKRVLVKGTNLIMFLPKTKSSFHRSLSLGSRSLHTTFFQKTWRRSDANRHIIFSNYFNLYVLIRLPVFEHYAQIFSRFDATFRSKH